MSGSCNDCGNVMCLCDSEGDDFEGVLSSGIIISHERYNGLKEEIAQLKEQLKREQDCVDFYANKGSWGEVETEFGLIKAHISPTDEQAIPSGVFRMLEISGEQSELYNVVGGKLARLTQQQRR